MKIAFLNHNLFGRGTYFRAWNLARELAARNHNVTLITFSDKVNPFPKTETVEGVKIIKTGKWFPTIATDGGYSPWDIFQRILYMSFNRFDVVHGFCHRFNVSLPWFWSKFIKPDSLYIADWADWWCKGGIITTLRSKWWDNWEGDISKKG